MPEHKTKKINTAEILHQIYGFLGEIKYPIYAGTHDKKLDYSILSEEQFRSLTFSDTISGNLDSYYAAGGKATDLMAESLMVVRSMLFDNRSKVRFNIDLVEEYDTNMEESYKKIMHWFASDLNKLWNVDTEYSHGISGEERLEKLKDVLKKIIYNILIINEILSIQNKQELIDYLHLVSEDDTNAKNRIINVLELIEKADGSGKTIIHEALLSARRDTKEGYI